MTTNLPFENWTEVLGSERLDRVLLWIDSLTAARFIETTGESYRLKDAQRRRRKKTQGVNTFDLSGKVRYNSRINLAPHFSTARRCNSQLRFTLGG